MKIYEGMASILPVKWLIFGSELGGIIEKRIDELSEFSDFYAPLFLKMIVLEPGDAPWLLDDVLGFILFERNCDAVEKHGDWFELTLVLSDDGAGVIIFIPNNSRTEKNILEYCSLQLKILSQ